MKNEQTLNTLKKFELSSADQQKAKGGYAPNGLYNFIELGKKSSIWGEVEVRRPIKKNSVNIGGDIGSIGKGNRR